MTGFRSIVKQIYIVEVPEKFYFKVSGASRHLDVSKNSLRKYTDLGLIQAKRLPGGDRLYSKDELDNFYNSLRDAI
jgi:hypothetical protein